MRSHAKAATAGSNLRWTGAAARLALFCVPALLLAALLVTPAQAAPVTVAEFGEAAGQVSLPLSVAVDQSNGSYYVADRNNARILKFNAANGFRLGWGYGVRDSKTLSPQTCGPEAVPPTTRCFKGEGALTATGPGAITPLAVAVDQTSHDVYVVDTNRRVSKFTSSGQFVYMVGKNVNKTKEVEAGATQAEKNICTAASGNTCGIGASGTGLNEFATPRSIAVDSSGVVWVGDSARMKSFSSTGAAGSQITLTGAGNTTSLTLDASGNFYVKSASLAGIRKLQAVTGTLLLTFDAAGSAVTATLDAAGNVYVGDSTSPYRFKVYDPTGVQTAQFGAGQVIGSPGAGNSGGNAIAIGQTAGSLYTASSDSSPSKSVVQAFPLPEPGPLLENPHVNNLEPTTVTLAAELNPEGHETTYHFEYGTTIGYGQSTTTKTLPGSAFDSEAVQEPLSGLIPNTTYHFRLVATNHCKPSEPSVECTVAGPDTTFTTRPAVGIDTQWASDVTAHTAELHAEMDPLGVQAEAWLEYGTTESYGQIVPLTNLGSGLGAVSRDAFLNGLQAGTTYHYRFAARDERDGNPYTVHGEDKTFITQFSGLGFSLADGRAWEMVSPPDKHGARLVGGAALQIQAAADGNGLAYPSKLSTEADPEGNRFPEVSTTLSRRAADGSWNSKDITTPNGVVVGTAGDSQGGEYKLFSADLSEALVEPRGFTPLSPEASERTPYLRQNTEPATFKPLVTGKEPFANVPPGTEFGGAGIVVTMVGASPDFSHFALSSIVPLAAGAPSGSTLYEWSDGQLTPLSVLPATEGGTIVNGAYVGSGIESSRSAISEDGSRIFWSKSAGVLEPASGLYARDTETGESGRLDIGKSEGNGNVYPIFQGASTDGVVVFFSDSRQLIEDAGAKGFDLYRCELPPGSVAAGCATLEDISIPAASGESAEVQGLAGGVAPDGESIYFVARGVLDETPNQFGDSAVSGAPNLYLWQQGEGARFIATLAEQDRADWGKTDFPQFEGAALSATSSPGGRYLAFMSQRSLAGYDSRDVTSGEEAQEVYRYDSLADRLACVSCNPSGARPQSAAPGRSLVDPWAQWGGLRAAATLPQATSNAVASDISLYRPRAVLDNGRIFFNAIDSLVPADSNGQWDVYEYEPSGVGDCSASSGGASIVRSGEACVSLISSGSAEEEAAFLDASETGDDAFFWTPSQLNETDTDHEVDIYDARVNGVPATLPKIVECLGEACQPAAQAPNDATPASAAFRGQGNREPSARRRCAKSKRLVRRNGKARCVARKGVHRKHRRAHRNRRAHR